MKESCSNQKLPPRPYGIFSLVYSHLETGKLISIGFLLLKSVSSKYSIKEGTVIELAKNQHQLEHLKYIQGDIK